MNIIKKYSLALWWNLSKPFRQARHKYKQIQLFKTLLSQTPQNPKIIIGASTRYKEGWIPTEAHFLNLLKTKDWDKYFKESSIKNLLAEHVWEHLSLEDGYIAACTCYKYLQKGGRLRVAVPDGFHSNPQYIDYVKPNGHGAGADDHKVLYTYTTLKDAFEKAGFEVNLLEYFDENGHFRHSEWDIEAGFIARSFQYDERNADGKPNYTSIILDAVK